MDSNQTVVSSENKTKHSSYSFEISKKNDDDNSVMLTLEDADPLFRRLMLAQPSLNLKNKFLYVLVQLMMAPAFQYILIGVGILRLPGIAMALAVWSPIGFISQLYLPRSYQTKFGVLQHSLCKQATFSIFQQTDKENIVDWYYCSVWFPECNFLNHCPSHVWY